MKIQVILLIIFSAFTMNLAVQCALGIKGASESKNCNRKSTLIKLGVIFISVIFLWFFFVKVIFSMFNGIFIYVLVFPVSYIIYEGLDYLFSRYILKRNTEDECFINFPGGITAAAVFICINIAENFPEAFLLSFGFTSGILVVFLTIREIRRRAILEAVPRFMQGNPLILVSMGLLSLIFSMVSLLVLRMISIG